MSSYDRDSVIGVVGRTPGLDLLRPLSEEEKAERAQALILNDVDKEMEDMRVDVVDRDPATLAMILGALEANGIHARLPQPPKKIPKEIPSEQEQRRRIEAAEAKRERRRKRRLTKGV